MSAGMGPWVSASPTLAAQTAADPGRPTTRLSSPRLHIRLVRHVRVLEVLRKLHGVGVVQEPGNRVLSQDHPLPSFGGGGGGGGGGLKRRMKRRKEESSQGKGTQKVVIHSMTFIRRWYFIHCRWW